MIHMSSYESVVLSKVSKMAVLQCEPTRKAGSCLFSVYVDSWCICLWSQIAMESEIRDVFRHCISFPVPISASVVSDELVDTANEKRCITILARKYIG